MTVHGRAGRLLMAGALVGTAIGLLPATPAKAIQPLPPSCPVLNGSSPDAVNPNPTTPTDGGNPYRYCTYTKTATSDNRVHSFEGTPLRVDLSIPTVHFYLQTLTNPAKNPLIMFLSGYSNDYCQFESLSLAGSPVAGCSDFIGEPGYHWNNAWAASQGIVALTFTPRGWYESCGKKLSINYSYVNDPACQSSTTYPKEQSWIHLYDRRYEIRDAQFLAGLITDTGLSNPDKIVTTGDSGGGGPSWDLALSQNQVVETSSSAVTTATCLAPPCINTSPWQSPAGTPLHLAAALPMYTWTDLVDSLVSNGTATDGFNGAPAPSTFNHDMPIGVEKESYVAGFFVEGFTLIAAKPPAGAQFAAPAADATADLTKWFFEINAGEPSFAANPDTPTILAEIGGPLRSPLAIPVPTCLPGAACTEIPIYVIQGLTDPLFPSLQPLTMINRLQGVDPNYPVWGFFGDVGHSYAQNPLDVWQQAHNAGNQFMTAALVTNTLGQFRQAFTQATITVDTTRCLAEQTLQTFANSTLGAIATTNLTFTTSTTQNTSNPSTSTEGVRTDPIAAVAQGKTCITIPASQSDPNQASYTFALSSPSTLVGGPVVNVSASIVGSSTELAARLWDVDGAGNQTLITRTVYRIDLGTAGSATKQLALELWPQAWQFCAGHSVKLELTQNDSPTWRTDNLPSTISLSAISTKPLLSLPVVPGAVCGPATGLADAPLVAAFPLVALATVGGVAVARRRRRRAAAG